MLGSFNASKRTLKIPKIVNRMDSDRVIYPRGLVSALKESDEASPPVKRVEIFAKDRRETYGILRVLNVAFSSERTLLDMAQVSDNVIQVRSVPGSSASATVEGGRRIVEDRLVLKRIDSKPGPITYSARTPDLHVSGQWLENHDLQNGARIIVSNPLEKYLVPPPGLGAASRTKDSENSERA